MDSTLEDLKNKPNLTRDDIAKLLESIAPPGKKLKTKINAVRKLEKSNFQGHDISTTLEGYNQF
jgi:hypothetical protein